MKRENIDDDVWQYVADEYGRFGDRWCDALRRGLGIPLPAQPATRARIARANGDGRRRLAEVRLDRRTRDREIAFRFGNGPWKTWTLPTDRENTIEVRRIRDEAVDYGRANGATEGQLNAIRKAFSDAGYYLARPSRGG